MVSNFFSKCVAIYVSFLRAASRAGKVRVFKVPETTSRLRSLIPVYFVDGMEGSQKGTSFPDGVAAGPRLPAGRRPNRNMDFGAGFEGQPASGS